MARGVAGAAKQCQKRSGWLMLRPSHGWPRENVVFPSWRVFAFAFSVHDGAGGISAPSFSYEVPRQPCKL